MARTEPTRETVTVRPGPGGRLQVIARHQSVHEILRAQGFTTPPNSSGPWEPPEGRHPDAAISRLQVILRNRHPTVVFTDERRFDDPTSSSSSAENVAAEISTEVEASPAATADPLPQPRSPSGSTTRSDPYPTPEAARNGARAIDEAAHAWDALLEDDESPGPQHLRELRDNIPTRIRAAQVTQDAAFGETRSTGSPRHDLDLVRKATDHLRTLYTAVSVLIGALENSPAHTGNAEITALGVLRERIHAHGEALLVTEEHLGDNSPRTATWTATPPHPESDPTAPSQARDVEPESSKPESLPEYERETEPEPPSALEPESAPEAVPASAPEGKPEPSPTPQPDPATPSTQEPRSAPQPQAPARQTTLPEPTDPPPPARTTLPPAPEPPPPGPEFFHWHSISLPPSRDRLHQHRRRALLHAWNNATTPRAGFRNAREHVRDLRDRADRYTTLARAAAKLANSPQREIQRSALHDLRVAAERHARHLYHNAGAIEHAHWRTRFAAPITHQPHPPRPRQAPAFHRVREQLDLANTRAEHAVTTRDSRAQAHRNGTLPGDFVHETRAEHHTAHQWMRAVWTRQWWRHADPGHIADVWQRAAEWAAHGDPVAAQTLQHMQGRIRQYHGVEASTPRIHGTNLSSVLIPTPPAPAQGPTVLWDYTVRDPQAPEGILARGRQAALPTDTPETVGRRVLAELAAHGTERAASHRASVEVVPTTDPEATPVVVTAERIPAIGRDQAQRDRTQRDVAERGAALKHSLDDTWWKSTHPTETGGLWRQVSSWTHGPARTDALAFLTDRIHNTYGVTVKTGMSAVQVTERLRESFTPAPANPSRVPGLALATHASRLFDHANRTENRIATGHVAAEDIDDQRQKARVGRLHARHLSALATEPEDSARPTTTDKLPRPDKEQFLRDIAADYRRSWGQDLTPPEADLLRLIVERGTATPTTPRPTPTTPAATTPTPGPDENLARPTPPRPQPPSAKRRSHLGTINDTLGQADRGLAATAPTGAPPLRRPPPTDPTPPSHALPAGVEVSL